MQSFHFKMVHLLSLKSPVNNIVHPGWELQYVVSLYKYRFLFN